MRVGLLGPLLVDSGTGPRPVGGLRVRALLARLALDAGHPVRARALVEAVWGDDPPAGQANALQSLVTRLRRALGDAGLLTSGPAGYRLAIEPTAVDAVRFEQLARTGRRELAASRPAEAAAVLREALALWRGPALADLRDAPFADAEAERLDRLRLAALTGRIEADLALAAGSGAAEEELVGELASLAAEHPVHERLHVHLIRALAGAGRAAEALVAYQRLRRHLAETLGADPGPELEAVHLAVLRGEVGPRPRPDPPRPGNLDAALTSFVGREDDVRRVVGLLGRARLVTLVGPGGVGKTRLAGECGRRLTPSGGVWLVALARVGSPDDVPRAVLDVLRARPAAARPRDPGPLPAAGRPAEQTVDRLEEALADDVVLVLDNCEHVIDAAAALTERLLGRCPGLRVLATSREPLRVAGETLHPVGPLETPERGWTAERARACAAVRLFDDRAAAVRPGFTLHDDSAGDTLGAAVEICRRLDGLPLAIELAAARLRHLPIEVVAVRLDDRFRLLTGGNRTALPRHQTLRAVVAWSWDLLDDGERALLERLAVVPGSVTEQAAQALADGGPGDVRELDVREVLAALVDKSLLHPVGTLDPGEPRYRMLETIREYGLEQLAGRGEVDAVRGRHARFLLELAERAEPHLYTADQVRWLARLSAERDNLLAAIRWTVEAGDAGTAVRFGAALCWFWTMRGNPPESVDLLGQVLDVPGPADPVARALVITAHTLGIETVAPPAEREAAVARLGRAIEGLDPGVHPLLDMARLAVAVGSPPHAPATDTGPIGSADDPEGGSEGPWSRSFELLVRGLMTRHAGDAPLAAGFLSRALTGFEELGDRWGLAITLSTLGSIRRQSGDDLGALTLSERATGYFRELGVREYAIENEVQAALLRARIGDVDGGRRQLKGLLDPVARTGWAEPWAQLHLGLAQLERQAGRPGPAREHARAGLAEVPPGQVIPAHLTDQLRDLLAQLDRCDGRPV